MATIVYGDGTKVNFNGTPTQQDIEDAYSQLKGPAATGIANSQTANTIQSGINPTDPTSGQAQATNQQTQPSLLQKIGNFIAPAASSISQAAAGGDQNSVSGKVLNFLTGGMAGQTASALSDYQARLDQAQQHDQQILQMIQQARAQGNTSRVKALTKILGIGADQPQPTVEDLATNGQGYQTNEQAIGNIATTGLNALSGGLIPGGGATTALGRIGEGALSGAAYGAAGGAQDNQDLTGILKSAATGAAAGGATTGAIEGASALKNAGRDILGKTAVGQVFGNPSKDTTAALFGRNAATNPNSDYNTLLNVANLASPNGVAGNPITDAVQKLLGGGGASKGFDIKGSGPAGLFAVHPEDQQILQKVIDYANGTISFKNPTELANALQEAKNVATAYGIPVNIPGSTTQQDITKGIADAFNVRKYSKGNQPDMNAVARSFAESFKPVLDNGGHIPLDFSQSILANAPDKQKALNTLWSDIGKNTVGANAENGANSVKSLDLLKQRIDAKYTTNPTTKEDKVMNAILAGMRNAVQSPLEAASPAYSQAMQAAQGSIAGSKFTPWLPQGTLAGLEAGGAGLAALTHILNPSTAPALALVSPKVQGMAIRGAGSVNRTLGKAVVPVAQQIKNNPGTQAALLKALGIIP